MLEKLKYHLENTSKEELQKEWKEIEEMDLPGPTVAEYIGFINNSKKIKIKITKVKRLKPCF